MNVWCKRGSSVAGSCQEIQHKSQFVFSVGRMMMIAMMILQWWFCNDDFAMMIMVMIIRMIMIQKLACQETQQNLSFVVLTKNLQTVSFLFIWCKNEQNTFYCSHFFKYPFSFLFCLYVERKSNFFRWGFSSCSHVLWLIIRYPSPTFLCGFKW